MGTKLSIDKHVSNLEDILELNTKLLEKIKFDCNIPDCITQHLKIWKFLEDKHPIKKVKSEPINLSTIQSSGFNFLSNECYLVLLIYKKAHEKSNQFTNFPHQMWGLVESYSNLTPRGLGCPVASSEQFESFLIPQRNDLKISFEYMIFVWNGKQANPLVKASALSNAFEVENLLNKGKDPLLEILFSGGVIRNKKLSKGSIMQLCSQAETQPYNQEILDDSTVRETVYLFNFLFPVPEKKREFSKLGDFLKKKKCISPTGAQSYKSNFISYLDQVEPKQTQEESQMSQLRLDKQLEVERQLEQEKLEKARKQRQMDLEVEKIDIIEDKKSAYFRISRTYNLERIDKRVRFESKDSCSQFLQFVPKIDLNCKNIDPDSLSSHREVDIRVPLVEGVEPSDMQKGSLKLQLPLNNTMKLSLTNLKFTKEDTTYKDIEQEDNTGFNFDIRDTERKKLKIQYFAEICSQVIGDYLYVGGEQIAYNREILKQIGVTHVINCAGDVCKNKFPEDFTYTTYYLKDSKTENIECLFYEVFGIIEKTKAQNGKVLIHCVQGVSRSVSLCIAYLIMHQKISYSAAFDIIKKNRGVASPNMGFTVQLLLFQKRLQSNYDSIPISPRVFAVGKGVSGGQSIVCRMLMDQLYSGKIVRTFDSRGVFLVQSEQDMFLWVGPECIKSDKYIKYALDYTHYLQQYEKAPLVQPILQSAHKETEFFWGLWGIDAPVIICQKIKEWDNWYEEINEEQFMREKEFTQQLYSSDKTEEVQQPILRPYLYIYPNLDDPIGVFDLEDLDHQYLCLLLKENKDAQLQVFIWRGNNWIGNEDQEKNFVDIIITKHYGHIQFENIFVYKEEPNEESEEFLDCFQ
ncbi:hypothetical protein pb186bvf_012971 [Paramecium bursaria]